jgi:predicted PurR-regulated permease PerM
MDPKLFRTLLAWSATLLLIALLGAIAAPFATAFVLAAAIAVPTFPVHERIERVLGGRKSAAAALSVLILALVVVIPVAFLLSILAAEAARGYRFLEEAAAFGRIPGVGEILDHPVVAPFTARGRQLLDSFGVDVKTNLLPAAKQGLGLLLGFASGALKNVFLFTVELFLMLIVLFFLYRDGAGLAGRAWELVPLRGRETARLREILTRTTSAVMVGIVGTSLLQGVLGGVGFWISGLPSPVLFGGVMAFASVIPFVGTALVWVPGAAYLLATGSPWGALFLAVWGLVVVGMADNVVRPMLISGSAGVSLPLMALGALGGFAALGVPGVVVGPLAVSLAVALLDILRDRRSASAEAEDGGAEPGE